MARDQHVSEEGVGRNVPSFVYHGMLLLAAALWGMGTVVLKDTIEAFPPMWLVGVRFTSAGVLAMLLFLPRVRRTFNRDTIAVGALLGLFVALTYLFNSTGLLFTTASKSVFYTSTYCVMVPFIVWVVRRRRPQRVHVVTAIVCLAGIALVSFSYGFGQVNFTVGDAMTLVSALAVGIHIVLVAHFALGRDVMALTCWQFLFCGLIALAVAPLFQGPLDMAVFQQPGVMRSLVYLVVFASVAALMLQNVGLAHVETITGSLLLTTECVFGTIFAIILLGEVLNVLTVCGFVLIGVAIVASELLGQGSDA